MPVIHKLPLHSLCFVDKITFLTNSKSVVDGRFFISSKKVQLARSESAAQAEDFWKLSAFGTCSDRKLPYIKRFIGIRSMELLHDEMKNN